jgi:hypothetical protein
MNQNPLLTRDSAGAVSFEYEEVLSRLNPVIESQARYVAAVCQRLYQSDLDWQDLAQGARIYLWGYLERRGNPGIPLLLILGRLRMYAERCRGRSVLRPHPGKRKRQYQRASLSEANAVICTALDPFPTFSDQQERRLLLDALQAARSLGDNQVEHAAILALRRLGRALEDDALTAEYNEQLRAWWRRERERARQEVTR